MLIFAGRNRVTSGFRLPDRPDHSGLDIVGDDSRDIRCPVDGVVKSSAIVKDRSNITSGWMTPTETGCISATWRAGP